jgi:hypothetical protein
MYFHLFWIPFFPLGKATHTVCLHCNENMEGEKVPVKLATAITSYKSKSYTPKWTFAGFGVIVFLYFYLFVRVSPIDWIQTTFQNWNKKTIPDKVILGESPAMRDCFVVVEKYDTTDKNNLNALRMDDQANLKFTMRVARIETINNDSLSVFYTKKVLHTSQEYNSDIEKLLTAISVNDDNFTVENSNKRMFHKSYLKKLYADGMLKGYYIDGKSIPYSIGPN